MDFCYLLFEFICNFKKLFIGCLNYSISSPCVHSWTVQGMLSGYQAEKVEFSNKLQVFLAILEVKNISTVRKPSHFHRLVSFGRIDAC